MTDTAIVPPTESSGPAPETRISPERRRGRPRGAVGPQESLRLEGQTTKSYGLGDGQQRTIRYLRLIVNQRQIPDDAAVAIEGGRITIEWSD